MSSPLPQALAGSGPLSGVLRAVLSVVVLAGAAVLALFALLLTWAVTLGVALVVLLRAAFARRGSAATPPQDGRRQADTTRSAPSTDADDTVAELEAFHGSLDEFMRGREDRDA